MPEHGADDDQDDQGDEGGRDDSGSDARVHPASLGTAAPEAGAYRPVSAQRPMRSYRLSGSSTTLNRSISPTSQRGVRNAAMRST